MDDNLHVELLLLFDFVPFKIVASFMECLDVLPRGLQVDDLCFVLPHFKNVLGLVHVLLKFKVIQR
jgi:hypothetical protein